MFTKAFNSKFLGYKLSSKLKTSYYPTNFPSKTVKPPFSNVPYYRYSKKAFKKARTSLSSFRVRDTNAVVGTE